MGEKDFTRKQAKSSSISKNKLSKTTERERERAMIANFQQCKAALLT